MEYKIAVLLAEDDRQVLKLLATLLRRNRFRVLEAKNGRDAIDFIDDPSRRIDVIVSDLHMPLVNGVGLARHNFESRRAPFIMLTIVNDSQVALDLLRYGVQDYLVKPVDKNLLIALIRNVVRRAARLRSPDDADPYEGNVGSITVPTKTAEISYTLKWIKRQVESVFTQKNLGKFLFFTYEFLLNAYEHGNLGIGEKEKGKLIEEDRLQEETARREAASDAMITVAVSVLKNEVAIKISDEGGGFDYGKYLRMKQDVLLDRLELPNGRGIYMAKLYFDAVVYSEGGSTVHLRKRLG